MFILEKIKEYAKTSRIALMNREETLSFAELDARSDAFAAWLLDHFGEDRAPVIIRGHKETNFLPCIFGALKSGRAYVPIDTTAPLERAAGIATDVSPSLVVDFTDQGLNSHGALLTSGALNDILQRPCRKEVPKTYWISGDKHAYILFTSGSTGKPKGVPITADNLTSFYRGLLPYYPGETGGVILNQISYSFDVSGCSIYAGLSQGMTLFTVDQTMVENMGDLFARLQNSGLAFWVSTPSLAEICVQSGVFNEKLLPKLDRFLFCGEVLTHNLCDRLAQRFPRAKILNTYGPTEATVLVTAVEVTEQMRRDPRPIPIGEPIAGTKLRLANGQGHDIELDGETGELLILGKSVGPGYFGQPSETGKGFFTDSLTGLRGYRTGDLCCRWNGMYYYRGRRDNQLKLNGFRIELEDVENNLQKLPNVARAAVVPIWSQERVQYLAAFLLLRQPDGLTALSRSIRLKRQAADYLPSYMIPRKFFVVDAYPLNISGKIDKKELARRVTGAKPE